MAPHDAANCKKPMETNNSTDSITQRHTQPRVVGEQERVEEGGEEGEVKIPFGAQ